MVRIPWVRFATQGYVVERLRRWELYRALLWPVSRPSHFPDRAPFVVGKRPAKNMLTGLLFSRFWTGDFDEASSVFA